MKLIYFLAIGIMLFGTSSVTHGQTIQERLRAQKEKLTGTKKGRVCAPDLSDEKVFELLGGGVADDGILSPFHRDNIGKVVFTKTKMEPADITEDDITTEFSINDPIYFTYFMATSYSNQILFPINADGSGLNQGWCWDHSFHKFYEESNGSGVPQLNTSGDNVVYLELDGQPITTFGINSVVFNDSKQTAVSGIIASDPTIALPSKQWMEFITNLQEGTHQFYMEVGGYNPKIGVTKNIIAKGAFRIKKEPGEHFTPTIGKNWSDYKARKSDPKMEAEMLALVKEYVATHRPEKTIVALKIDNPDWTISRTESIVPVITGRYIDALCYTVRPDGICRVELYTFRQAYDGTGYQATMYCSGPGGFIKAIDCD